eukprot:TRINITY_DN77983_c0_g1_i1.p1 TRINITY_DN77983_c0_g1~~TRINITY_DN77983_c0_g1_i1.p1  ORF type:complete len:335 (+),score=50.73 TRINITY_DN77983_c0_g1_i1:57-1061(+)
MGRVVVTGAGGRLGGKIAAELKRRAYHVVGVDMIARPGHVTDEIVSEYIQCNLAEEGAAKKTMVAAMAGADAVVHCAAWPGPAKTGPPAVAKTGADIGAGEIIGLEDTSPTSLLRDNVVMTAQMCDAAVEAGVRRFVFSSSAFAMGWSHASSGPQSWTPNYLPVDEDHAPMPTETYGLSKQVCEEILRTAARTAKSTSFVSLRFTNIIKTENWSKLPWPAPTAGKCPPLVFWAYTHEDDVVDAHVQSVLREGAAAAGEHEAYLIAAPDTRYKEATMELLSTLVGIKAMASSSTGGPLEGNDSPISCRKARQRLGFEPRSWQGDDAKAAKRARMA